MNLREFFFGGVNDEAAGTKRLLALLNLILFLTGYGAAVYFFAARLYGRLLPLKTLYRLGLFNPFTFNRWLNHYRHTSAYNLVCLILIPLCLFTLWFLYRVQKCGRLGSRDSTLHGSAKFATYEDIKRAGLRVNKGVYVGSYMHKGRQLYLRHNGKEHIIALAPTRSGKGVGLVIPTLLGWEESALVLDIKGENWSLTAGSRQAHGHKVLRWDPTDIVPGRSAKYNPLECIRLKTPFETGDAQNVSLILVGSEGSKEPKGNDFWNDAAGKCFMAFIIHVLYSVDYERCAILDTFSKKAAYEKDGRWYSYARDERGNLLSDRETGEPIKTDRLYPEDRLPWKLRAGMELDAALEEKPWPVASMGEVLSLMSASNLRGQLKSMAHAYHRTPDSTYKFKDVRGNDIDDVTHPLVTMNVNFLLQQPDETLGNIMATTQSKLNVFMDPVVIANTADSDITIRDLMDADEPVSLYMVLNPSNLTRLQPLFRLFITQIINELTPEMEFVDGELKSPFRHKLLLLLDEFPALGKLDIFEKAIAFFGGWNIKAYLICQDLDQLQAKYGREETITANCHIQIVYAPNKTGTAEYISKRAGVSTVVEENRSYSYGGGGKGRNWNVSLQKTQRPLLTTDEVLQLPGPVKDSSGNIIRPGDMLIMPAGAPVVRGTQILYFQDGYFSRQSKIPAPDKSDRLPVRAPLHLWEIVKRDQENAKKKKEQQRKEAERQEEQERMIKEMLTSGGTEEPEIEDYED